MPCAGRDAAKFLLCCLHESLCCILCSLICILVSKKLYIYFRDGEARVFCSLLETPVPRGCSAVSAGGWEGLGHAGGWGGVNTHVRTESFSILARLVLLARLRGSTLFWDGFKMGLRILLSAVLCLPAARCWPSSGQEGPSPHCQSPGWHKQNWCVQPELSEEKGGLISLVAGLRHLVSFIISACAQPQDGGCARGIRASVGAGDTESMDKNTPQSRKKSRIAPSGRAHRF